LFGVVIGSARNESQFRLKRTLARFFETASVRCRIGMAGKSMELAYQNITWPNIRNIEIYTLLRSPKVPDGPRRLQTIERFGDHQMEILKFPIDSK
jgi:hypothetical protein